MFVSKCLYKRYLPHTHQLLSLNINKTAWIASQYQLFCNNTQSDSISQETLTHPSCASHEVPDHSESPQHDVVSCAVKLIDTESVSGNEFPMFRVLKSWLEVRGWTVDKQEVAKERYNLLAYPKGITPSDITLLFNSHIDTVPPYFPSNIIDTPSGAKLCGRGACDTKSLIAAQLFAANELKNKHKNIGLLYVVGEEVDHCGMIKANELNLKPKYLIVGEPTESRTIKSQKGILKFELICIGKEAHSGYPETGVSAINVLLDVLHEMIHHKWPSVEDIGDTTVNIGTVQSGVASNVIPNKSQCVVMFRCVTSPEEIEKEVMRIIQNHDTNKQITFRKMSQAFPQRYCGLDEEYNPGIACFNTDIPYFEEYRKGNVVPVLFGCGSIKNAHTAHEYVMVDDLKRCVQSYCDIAETLLSGKYDNYLKSRSKLL
eukprot:822596_1